ncbi:hypothetical protein T05_494 [Trichinella murrelli]|uniref:Uncharacterized protein n=1 Tax=Trichinella murrelli TaxID=144512 RepID=A0A0V0TTW9_9BILA|nr:hypothetical protein T05_494 [Trichinella murrelli]
MGDEASSPLERQALVRGVSSAVLVEMHIKHTNEPLPSKVAALIDWLVDEMLNTNYFDHQFGIKRKKQVSFATAEQEGPESVANFEKL